MDELKTLGKLEKLYDQINERSGFRTKAEFLNWGAKIEPLLGFNDRYQTQFEYDLELIHLDSSSQMAEPLANRMRTTLLQAIEQLKHQIDSDDKPEGYEPVDSSKEYIHPDRMKDLREVTTSQFDLSKLLCICKELNDSYRANSVLSVILLTRALIDHVPPVFGFKTFNEVANNYNGTKSFKDSMNILNSSSRKIADQHLHTPIRISESVPTMNQVDFSQNIDVLLAEVYRIMKNP